MCCQARDVIRSEGGLLREPLLTVSFLSRHLRDWQTCEGLAALSCFLAANVKSGSRPSTLRCRLVVVTRGRLGGGLLAGTAVEASARCTYTK